MAVLFGILAALPFVPAILLFFAHFVLGWFAMCAAWVFFAMIKSVYFVAPAAVVVERLGPAAGLGRSGKLTGGSRWAVFGVWFILGIITNVVTRVSGVVVEASMANFDSFEAFRWFALGAGWVVTIVFTALEAVAVGVVYYKLKVKVEGVGEDELAAIFD
jgi:hypothetical protein